MKPHGATENSLQINSTEIADKTAIGENGIGGSAGTQDNSTSGTSTNNDSALGDNLRNFRKLSNSTTNEDQQQQDNSSTLVTANITTNDLITSNAPTMLIFNADGLMQQRIQSQPQQAQQELQHFAQAGQNNNSNIFHVNNWPQQDNKSSNDFCTDFMF